jgi:hypothetical protein
MVAAAYISDVRASAVSAIARRSSIACAASPESVATLGIQASAFCPAAIGLLTGTDAGQRTIDRPRTFIESKRGGASSENLLFGFDNEEGRGRERGNYQRAQRQFGRT